MERADPLFLLMGLPTIPVMLVLGKMIRWEDYVVRLWQRHSAKLNGIVPGKASLCAPWFNTSIKNGGFIQLRDIVSSSNSKQKAAVYGYCQCYA